MASSETIRIGIVGAGGNTRARHIPGLLAIEGVEIAVVCNRTEASAKRVIDEMGQASAPRIAGHWTEVVDDPDVDAVLIGTWPYLHCEVTIAALTAGKHVLTEARMARNAREAERMLETSRFHPSLVAQIVPAPMTLDVDAGVADLIASGELGDLREVCVTATSGQFADEAAPCTWRQDLEYSGHNILSLGIFHETVIRWLKEDPMWVIGDAEVFVSERENPETGTYQPIQIPDTVSVIGRFPFGARLVYHLSGLESGLPRSEIRLNGSRACLRWSGGKLFLATVGGQEQEVEIPDEKRRGWRVEADFIDSIRTGAPVTLTRLETGLRYMKFIDAVWHSWKDGGRKMHL